MTRTFRETNWRAIAKTVSWRILATFTTGFLVWIFTRELTLAAMVGGLEAVAKLILYYAHERVWDRIHLGREEIQPAVLWFTGLSGSGKSTIAESVFDELTKRRYKAERLDGDTIRDIFPKTGFAREDRDQHIRRVGYLASKLEENGVFVVASFVSPYEDSRQFVRSLCRNFIEIYVSTPLEECERRDVKGLYSMARRGEITNFTGIDDPYEAPSSPDLTIDTRATSVAEATDQVIQRVKPYL